MCTSWRQANPLSAVFSIRPAITCTHRSLRQEEVNHELKETMLLKNIQ